MKKKHGVLVIDDSPTVRRLVKRALSQAGYTVITAENGEEGFEVARREMPSVILVDFVMPKMNGFEFCKKIRADSDLCSTPIVLITSKGSDVGKGFEEKFGISHYLQKPFEPEILLEVLQNVLSGVGSASRAESGSISQGSPSSSLPGSGKAAAGAQDATSPEADRNTYENAAVWENISKELTALLKSAVIQTLKETDLGRPLGCVLSGDIRYISINDVINFARMSGLSGKLSVVTDSFNSQILLEDGDVAFASICRTDPRMSLEELMVSDTGPLSDAIRTCFADAGGCCLKAGGLLLENGLITEDALLRYYKLLTENAVHESISATSGRFSVEDIPLHPVLQKIRLKDSKTAQLSRAKKNGATEGS